VTVAQKLFISCFLPLFLFASEIEFKAEANLYSDQLKFDVFNDKWDSLPSKKEMNHLIDHSYFQASYSQNGYVFGMDYFSDGIVKLNRGFIETWYYGENNFFTILKKSDLGYYVTDPSLYALMNYSEYVSVFAGKRFEFKNSSFQVRFHILKGVKLHYIKLTGSNTNDRFLADLEYYYTDENILTGDYNNQSSDSIGTKIDISYRYKKGRWEFFAGADNILGFIKWKNIAYMYYNFDSNTKYIGDDGYYHYRPFGVGKYTYGVTYTQKLPYFINYAFSYSFSKHFKIGDEGIYSYGGYYNLFYGLYRHFKFGYIPENGNIVLGTVWNGFKLELSNNIKEHSTLIKALLEIKI